ncbi:MAG: BatA domain-containing protein [Fuerstiella sp.]|nr:BatA domain-containing protein [Fuerstiella sp.]
MDFLAPMFAAIGVAAASIPVVLHMLRRAPTQNMPFSIVKFLKPSRPKLTKRSNIEHWPLMLLRILALVLIGLAFARPFLREVIPLDLQDDVVQSVTILVDKSASMRRDGIYEKVQQTIRETVNELGDQDLLSVAVFSNTSRTLLSRERWATASDDEQAAMVEGVVENYEPDWMATDTGTAMRMAADELAQESKDRRKVKARRLVLITDFQRGSDLDELKSGNWPANVDVELKAIEPTNKGNVGVTFVNDRRADRIRVRVASAGDSVQQEFTLQPFDVSGAAVREQIKVTVAPGQRRSLILPAADPQAGKTIAGVELQGDEHPFDNVIDLPEVENPIVKVAHIGPAERNDPESMRYYLQRVLDGNVERDVQLIDLVQDGGVVLPIPMDVKFAVVTDSVPPGLLNSVSEFLDRSGTLLVAPPSVDAVLSLKKFLPGTLDVTEADVDEYAMLGKIDFEHPLFSTFSDARFADFSSIKFWQHRNLVLPHINQTNIRQVGGNTTPVSDQADVSQSLSEIKTAIGSSVEDRQDGNCFVVAKFDSGQPAIVEVTTEENGRIVLFATGWHPTDSQWALSTRFPPLLTRILSLASPAQKDQIRQTVGDVIRPGQLVSSEEWAVTAPDGTSVRWDQSPSERTVAAGLVNDGGDDDPSPQAPTRPANGQNTVTLDQPGRFTVTGKTDDGEYSVSLIAGLSASESRTEMLPLGQLQVLGIGVKSDVEAQLEAENSSAEEINKGQLSANDLERKQKWWRWLLLAGLGCLVLESVWASAIERRQAAEAA